MLFSVVWENGKYNINLYSKTESKPKAKISGVKYHWKRLMKTQAEKDWVVGRCGRFPGSKHLVDARWQTMYIGPPNWSSVEGPIYWQRHTPSGILSTTSFLNENFFNNISVICREPLKPINNKRQIMQWTIATVRCGSVQWRRKVKNMRTKNDQSCLLTISTPEKETNLSINKILFSCLYYFVLIF